MTKPDFSAQTLESADLENSRDWIKARLDEWREQGCTWSRAAVDDHMKPTVLLLEGWRERPDDEGEPQFHLTAID